ncbi:MAG: MarR family EPS-associated transcriptional regulator [Proteobacteria bacterium]|nr:MarR family EPS-associated transcriptional regulator [Pseudomonadota bacterium]MDE3207274.1 MarR family EPS-associated transcriptional regulator [Pseudomonadota bacterium]
MLTDEYRYRILKRLDANPVLSQRDLAKELGISLGWANYCLKALIGRGLVKVNNFRNSKNRSGYSYYLTPKGIEEKTKITISFLKLKILEYEALRCEIENLQREADQSRISASEVIFPDIPVK